ncbi:MAG: UDP-galactose 4-epimerase [Actinomycetia bacterium]|nr:UDP-galactose 4-epimerase [Actinomycetes bacterium]
MNVLVTGGAGYIGSHTCVELLQAGNRVVVVDNLANSSPVAIGRIREISGVDIEFHDVDLRDADALDAVFARHAIDAVVHFAGLKAVGESVAEPLRYYDNNVIGTLNLLGAMTKHGVRRLVFSSSATVYGAPDVVPIAEEAPLGPINPYGRTKLMIEDISRDVAASTPGWRIVLLRYFNPVGAHESGRLGEDPHGIPNNLMPFVMQVAVGRLPEIGVFGDDYATPDGTCLRDYVHVVDLARGHVDALSHIDTIEGCRAVNLGTGKGSSVLEVIRAASKAVGRDLPYKVVGRRAGDAPSVYADPTLAWQLFHWRADRTLTDMARDHWNWQRTNPNGYA